MKDLFGPVLQFTIIDGEITDINGKMQCKIIDSFSEEHKISWFYYSNKKNY